MSTNLSAQLREAAGKAIGGSWDCVPSTEHHGPYVTTDFGSTVCDFYAMSNPNALSVRNGGDSVPIHYLHEWADANAAFVALANPANILALLDKLERQTAVLKEYVGQYCEGFCEEDDRCTYDCGGCLARASLLKEDSQ